ncbi:hypothetical protein AKJ52_01425 [candidate division MSBL1 archaeon SCGC-AAA382C18]|uniref:Homoserine kinase n=1 Tax=candidate division MSBL1 archaeon SCGC-AAA382C18 TaxID=1698281 RepID=A0A133VK83_9EURY|nr:hypothetical protein AKJ52_01425 [candidate division MSBL1 archaeon SCGC-AAA382C18]
MNTSVKVTSPSSIANLGPGFDVFAMALNEPVDKVEMSFSEEMNISDVSNFKNIPRDPHSNSVTLAAKRVFKMAGEERNLDISIEKNIEIGKGLGSSGASAAAGAVAANALLGNPLGEAKLIEAAGFAEEKIAGTAHYDNVAASILGDFVIIGSSQPLEFEILDVPEMKLVLAVPGNRASTREGRKSLPKEVRLSDSVSNVGRACLMVSSLHRGDIESFARNIVDSIVEPIRTSTMKRVERVKEAAIESGALGSAMSGAGPSVFAILEPDDDEGEVKKAMKEAFESEGQECRVFSTEPGVGCSIEVEE